MVPESTAGMGGTRVPSRDEEQPHPKPMVTSILWDAFSQKLSLRS